MKCNSSARVLLHALLSTIDQGEKLCYGAGHHLFLPVLQQPWVKCNHRVAVTFSINADLCFHSERLMVVKIKIVPSSK